MPILLKRCCLALAAVMLASVAATCLFKQGESSRERGKFTARAQAALPMRVLWLWERPENLISLRRSDTAVAVLEETLFLGAFARALPRRQPFLLPPGIMRIAVVRIETGSQFASHLDDQALLRSAVHLLADTAREPGLRALQIDFDARRSERPFYRRLLLALREQMPPTLPLDITALASWCSTDDWLGDLPIDEATPMFFRMEPDRRRLLVTSPAYRIREPLCQHSVGVSTREPWPLDTAGKRVYVFADRGWAEDLPILAAADLQPRLLTGSTLR